MFMLEFDKIKRAMSANGYPKKYVEKATQRQIKNSAAGKVNRTEDQSTFVSARIPHTAVRAFINNLFMFY